MSRNFKTLPDMALEPSATPCPKRKDYVLLTCMGGGGTHTLIFLPYCVSLGLNYIFSFNLACLLLNMLIF